MFLKECPGLFINLPNRVAKFLMNSVTDTLNTHANLQRWGKTMSSKCKACGNHETLHHVLNNCNTFLNQGRYTWRHDNVLSYIHNHLKSVRTENTTLNCDIGDRKGMSTVPLSCTATDLIPDICLLSTDDLGQKHLIILELTIPFELNIDSAHERKTNKYAPIISDAESNNVQTEFIGLEIGSRGFISAENDRRLKRIFKLGNSDISYKNFKRNVSKLAIVSSFAIFHAKNDPEWENIPVMSVPYGN